MSSKIFDYLRKRTKPAMTQPEREALQREAKRKEMMRTICAHVLDEAGKPRIARAARTPSVVSRTIKARVPADPRTGRRWNYVSKTTGAK